MTSIWITLCVCLTVLVLAWMALRFPWAAVRNSGLGAVNARVEELRAAIQDHESTTAKVARQYDEMREHFDRKIDEVREERSRLSQAKGVR